MHSRPAHLWDLTRINKTYFFLFNTIASDKNNNAFRWFYNGMIWIEFDIWINSKKKLHVRNVEIFVEDKLNSFGILYYYVCKEIAKRILTKVGIALLNRHISLWAQSTIGSSFLWFLFLFSISLSVSDECRFRSSERWNFTRAQSSVSYIP